MLLSKVAARNYGDFLGLFGNSAPILIDINLILQYVVLILLVVGYIKKKPFKTHGTFMALATILNLSTILLIMAPALIQYAAFYDATIYFHAIVGILVQVISLVFVLRFFMATRAGNPLMCGKRLHMYIAISLWFITVLGGTFFYLNAYVFV
jgi:hypothetical protein